MYTNPYKQYSAMLGMIVIRRINILYLQETEGRRKDRETHLEEGKGVVGVRRRSEEKEWGEGGEEKDCNKKEK